MAMDPVQFEALRARLRAQKESGNIAPQQGAGMPPAQFEALRERLRAQKQQQQPGLFQKIGSAVKTIASPVIGAAKGLFGIPYEIAGAGQKLTEFGLGLFGKKPPAPPLEPKPIQEALKPVGTGQQIGYWAEQLGEFLAPVGEISKAEKGIEAVTEASKLPPLLKTVTKIAGKAGVEALGGAGVSLGQTKDVGQATKTGILFGGLKGITGTVGAFAKAFGLPEHLYSTIFKTAAGDMLQELKTGGLKNLQETSPELFKKYVDEGIIKTGKDGQVILDETTARQALDRGLKGSLRGMANTVVKNTLELESKAQEITSTTDQRIKIPSPRRLGSLLREVAEKYKNVARGGTARKALDFAKKVESQEGLNGEDTLSLRRFLDSLRFQSTYDPQKTISTSQENFKFWSDLVRRKLNNIPGMSPIMKDYSFHIDAINAIAKAAAQTGNRELINLLDVIIFEGGLAGGDIGLGGGLSIARKLLLLPSFKTRIGQAIEKGGVPTKTGTLFKAATDKSINQ